MKSRFLLPLMLVMLVSAAAAQDGQANDYFGGLHRKGSQLIELSTGVQAPLFIIPKDISATESSTLGFGASFSLRYQYFVANSVSVGGTLGGAFNGTIAGRSLFLAPISLHAGYWWGTAPMEYTAGIDLGMNVLRLSGKGMITPFAKLGGGVFRQISEAWSLGGQAYWWLVPEIHTGAYADLTRYGNFMEISFSAVYHF